MVAAGEPIAEIETEKTNVEIESPAAGVLMKIVAPEGTEGLTAGGLLAVLDDDEGATAVSREPVVPAVPLVPLVPLVDEARSPASPPAPPVEPVVPEPSALALESVAAGSRNATPLAGRMAAVAGLDISELEGTGAGGRVTKRDVDRALGVQLDSVGSDRRHETGGPVTAYEDHPLTAMQRVTASRMADAKRTVPHFYLRTECDAGALVEERLRLKGKGAGITLTDLMVRVSASRVSMPSSTPRRARSSASAPSPSSRSSVTARSPSASAWSARSRPTTARSTARSEPSSCGKSSASSRRHPSCCRALRDRCLDGLRATPDFTTGC